MTAPDEMPGMPDHPDIELVGEEIGFARFMRVDVVRFRHRLFSGAWSGERVYDVMRRGDAVAILLYDPERDCVVLVEQFRLPPLYVGMSPWLVEVVAGLAESGESLDAVARRETTEETGLDPIGELLPVQRYLPTPGATDEAVMLFCGRVDAGAADGIHGVAEENEELRIVVKSLAEIEAMLDAGQIETGHTLIALYWLLRHRDRLRREWGVR